jgi:ABC transporter DrrB family efflux protein
MISSMPTPVRSRLTPADTVRGTLVLTRRNLLRNVRIPQLLLIATVQPVMFLLLFNFVFGGAIGQTLPPGVDSYTTYLIPGLLAQIVAFRAPQTAVGLTEDLSKGVIDRFRALPMSRSAVLAGRTLADLLRNTFVYILMLAVGFAVGFRYQTSAVAFLGGVALALLFGYSLSWAGAAVGLYVRNPEAAGSAMGLPMFPLVFASSVFVPTDTMPGWLRMFADHQPITVIANSVRALMLGDAALPAGTSLAGQLFLSLVWIAGLTILFAMLAVRAYRRVVS